MRDGTTRRGWLRGLLGACLAALGGQPRTAQADTPPAPPPPPVRYIDYARDTGPGDRVATYLYDAAGRLHQVSHGPAGGQVRPWRRKGKGRGKA